MHMHYINIACATEVPHMCMLYKYFDNSKSRWIYFFRKMNNSNLFIDTSKFLYKTRKERN